MITTKITEKEKQELWTIRYVLLDDPRIPAWSWCMFRGDKFAIKGCHKFMEVILYAEQNGFNNVEVIESGPHGI